ncbi:MAG: DEAD/DEAH box helicase, partial [Lachnospiraceae bacterium]|nr:DEAD/DEAH box helicase [Lachnospiraceae bacterium]
MTLPWNEPISIIKGIGEKTSTLFHRVGVFSLWDLLLYLPRDYARYPEPVAPDSIRPGMQAAVRLTLKSSPTVSHFRGLTILNAVGQAGEARLGLTWFNMPYLKKTLIPGMCRIFYGKVSMGRAGLQIEQAKIFQEEEYRTLIPTLHPVYSLTKGLTSKGIAKAVKAALDKLSPLPDPLSDRERESLGIMDLESAFRLLHFPKDPSTTAAGRKRLVFDEFLSFLISVRRMKEEKEVLQNSFPMIETAETKQVVERLPYRLTGAQERVLKEIFEDLEGKRAMNRLVQGDVGSGKTIVAVIALIMAASNGYQGALMAPTEVLASQHAGKIQALLEECGLPFKTVLLTGSLTAAEKRKAKAEIASGEAQIIVGTHALIQDKVQYQNLALVITDEQHRFGVRQRQTLADKAGESGAGAGGSDGTGTSEAGFGTSETGADGTGTFGTEADGVVGSGTPETGADGSGTLGTKASGVDGARSSRTGSSGVDGFGTFEIGARERDWGKTDLSATACKDDCARVINALKGDLSQA